MPFGEEVVVVIAGGRKLAEDEASVLSWLLV